MFAKRIDDAVKKEKIITERFFEPSRSAWPERALMLQTVKKSCHGKILRAVSKYMAVLGTYVTNR